MALYADFVELACLSADYAVERRAELLNVYDIEFRLVCQISANGNVVLLSGDFLLYYNQFGTTIYVTHLLDGNTKSYCLDIPLDRAFFIHPVVLVQFGDYTAMFDLESGLLTNFLENCRLTAGDNVVALEYSGSVFIFAQKRNAHYFLDEIEEFGDLRCVAGNFALFYDYQCVVNSGGSVNKAQQYWNLDGRAFVCAKSLGYRFFVVAGGFLTVLNNEVCEFVIELASSNTAMLNNCVLYETGKMLAFHGKKAQMVVSNSLICVFSGNIAFIVQYAQEPLVFAIDCAAPIWSCAVIENEAYLSLENALLVFSDGRAKLLQVGYHHSIANFAGRLVIERTDSGF